MSPAQEGRVLLKDSGKQRPERDEEWKLTLGPMQGVPAAEYLPLLQLSQI